jgi:hypothetical protein
MAVVAANQSTNSKESLTATVGHSHRRKQPQIVTIWQECQAYHEMLEAVATISSNQQPAHQTSLFHNASSA